MATFFEIKNVITTRYELRIAELKEAYTFVEKFLHFKYNVRDNLESSWLAIHNALEKYDGSWSLEVRGNELVINTSSVEHTLFDVLEVTEICVRNNILVVYLRN